MAATQQGGRRPGNGRPRFVPAASKRPARAVLKFDKELHTQLEQLEAAGRISLGLTVCGASSFSGGSIYAHACVIPDRGTVWSGIRLDNYVMYRSAHARPVAQHQTLRYDTSTSDGTNCLVESNDVSDDKVMQ